MMKNDKKFLETIQDPLNVKHKNYVFDEHLIIDLVKMSNYQFIKAMLEMNAKVDVFSKKSFNLETNKNVTVAVGTSMFKIAYLIRNKKILAMMIASRDKNDSGLYETMEAENIFYKEILNKNKEDLAQPLIMLDPNALIP